MAQVIFIVDDFRMPVKISAQKATKDIVEKNLEMLTMHSDTESAWLFVPELEVLYELTDKVNIKKDFGNNMYGISLYNYILEDIGIAYNYHIQTRRIELEDYCNSKPNRIFDSEALRHFAAVDIMLASNTHMDSWAYLAELSPNARHIFCIVHPHGINSYEFLKGQSIERAVEKYVGALKQENLLDIILPNSLERKKISETIHDVVNYISREVKGFMQVSYAPKKFDFAEISDKAVKTTPNPN